MPVDVQRRRAVGLEQDFGEEARDGALAAAGVGDEGVVGGRGRGGCGDGGFVSFEGGEGEGAVVEGAFGGFEGGAGGLGWGWGVVVDVVVVHDGGVGRGWLRNF